MNKAGSLIKRVKSGIFYFSLLGLLALAVAAALLTEPRFEETASAQKRGPVMYDEELMAMAVDMKSAGAYAVYAEKGSTAENVQGRSFDGRTEGLADVKNDLKASLNWINNLPCTAVSGDLSGRTFAPGIYCVDSGRLAGEMTFSGGG